MPFSTFADVKSIVDTDISNADVTNIIKWVDANIKLKIDDTSVPDGLTAGEWNSFLEGLSATWAAFRCMLKDPSAQFLGEYREDRAAALKMLKEEIDDAIRTGSGPGMSYHSVALPSLTTDP